jgi:hypothetical protein
MRFLSSILVGSAAFAVAIGVSATDPPPSHAPPAFHTDAEALERAVLDATLALLREDAAAARRALDRMEAGCARRTVEDDPTLSWQLAAWDEGFHRQLDTARELAKRGDVDGTYDTLAWLQRGCRGCHRQARLDGRIPAAPPPPDGGR